MLNLVNHFEYLSKNFSLTIKSIDFWTIFFKCQLNIDEDNLILSWNFFVKVGNFVN